MPGRLSVRQACAAGASLAPGDRSVLSLIRLAGIELTDLTRDGYEARKASLEAAAGDLTREVFEYWSQNRELSVEFDIDFERPGADGYEGPFVELRIRNLRHGVTLNFSDRSQGFTWFFSLLASLSQLERSKRLILLLDEPGTSLHGSAQQDLLRFIDERLVPTHQVVYSTHSPFLLDPKRLDRVRTVEDHGDDGSRVSGALFDHSNGTRLPLEVAFGRHLVRSLTAGSADLLVRAPSDHIYLRAVSAHLESLGRACLDPRWRIVPVGGLDGVSAFGSLVGGGAERMAVLFDARALDGLAADSPIGRRLLEGRGVIRVADFVPARPEIVEVIEEPEPARALDGIDFTPGGEPPDRVEGGLNGPDPELAVRRPPTGRKETRRPPISMPLHSPRPWRRRRPRRRRKRRRRGERRLGRGWRRIPRIRRLSRRSPRPPPARRRTARGSRSRTSLPRTSTSTSSTVPGPPPSSPSRCAAPAASSGASRR